MISQDKRSSIFRDAIFSVFTQVMGEYAGKGLSGVHSFRVIQNGVSMFEGGKKGSLFLIYFLFPFFICYLEWQLKLPNDLVYQKNLGYRQTTHEVEMQCEYAKFHIGKMTDNVVWYNRRYFIFQDMGKSRPDWRYRGTILSSRITVFKETDPIMQIYSFTEFTEVS